MDRGLSFRSRVLAAWNRVSARSTVCLVAIFLLIGVVGAGLFSPFGLNVFEDVGSAADWVAAIGTWVIGFGAISLAVGDRSLKLRERQERRISELEINLEEVQKVARYARSAVSEFGDAVKSLREEYRMASLMGFRDSVALPHIRRTAYVLTWTPAQLRLLSPTASALADDVSRKGERIISRSDEVTGKGSAANQMSAATELRDAIMEVSPLLSQLQKAAEADALAVRKSIERIQARLDRDID